MTAHGECSTAGEQRKPSAVSLRGLDGLNFFAADVRTGVGPFLAIYLASTLHWDPSRVGIAMSAMSIGTLIAQTPAGAIIDRIDSKRLFVGAASVLIAIACIVMAETSNFYAIVGAQAIAGVAADVFPPAIAAITLGLVGRGAMARQTGRNEAFNHAGNVVAAILAGVLGAYVAAKGVFYLTVVLAGACVATITFIRPGEIDNQLARGGDGEKAAGKPMKLRDLFRDARLVWFILAVTLFHLPMQPCCRPSARNSHKASLRHRCTCRRASSRRSW
jgi:predicted MFS family arabinose efflux permease